MFSTLLEAVGKASPYNETFENILGAVASVFFGALIIFLLVVIIKNSKKGK